MDCFVALLLAMTKVTADQPRHYHQIKSASGFAGRALSFGHSDLAPRQSSNLNETLSLAR